MEKSARIFTLYAKEDESFAEQLTIHLSLLRRKAIIHDFTDHEIADSSEWTDEQQRNFADSNFIIFLVSPALINSDYAAHPLIQNALNNSETNQTVVPVLIRNCEFSQQPIAHFAWLPANGQPIESALWRDRDHAWRSVTDGLKEMITGEKVMEAISPQATVSLPSTKNLPLASSARSGISWPVQILLSLVVLSAMGGITYYLVNYKPADQEVAAKIMAPVDTVTEAPVTEPEAIVQTDPVINSPEPGPKKPAKKAVAKKTTVKPGNHIESKVEIDTIIAAPLPPPPKIPTLKSSDMEQMLFGFSQGTMDESEFSKYLCNKLSTTVRYEKKSMSFQEMCTAIKEVKAKKIKKIAVLSMSYDGSCISTMEVNLRKKGLFN